MTCTIRLEVLLYALSRVGMMVSVWCSLCAREYKEAKASKDN